MNAMAASRHVVTRWALFLAALFFFCFWTGHCLGQEIDPSHKFAWATDAGWVNFKPTHGGVTVYDSHLEGYAWAENIGWIRLGTHEGGGTHSYANDSPTTYGVNRSGGQLSGFAWSSHAGWINFNPTHGGVVINQTTGEFSGYAWSETAGWIKFAGTALDSTTYMVKMSGSSTHTVTPSAGTGGSVSPSTPQSVNHGQTATFTVTANSGYTRNDAVGGVCPAGSWSGDDWTTGTITEDCSVEFSFTPIAPTTYTVTPSAGTGGSVSPNTPQSVNHGQTATFTVTPDSGYMRNAAVGGTCPAGSWSGDDWTTGIITENCDVFFTFGLAPEVGNLQVTIEPEGARYAGAQWRRAGTAHWFNSDATENDLPVGNYTVEFKPVSGYNTPANQIVAIQESQTAQTTGTYTSANVPGTLKWTPFRINQADGDPYVRSSPVLSLDGSMAYFGANDGKVYAVNTVDGSKQWEFLTTAGQPVRSSPAVGLDGTIYVGGNDKKMYAIDGAAGTKLWEVGTGGNIWSSPSVGPDGAVYFGVNDKILDAYLANGTLKWSKDLGSEVIPSPAISGDYVYVGTSNGELHARHLSNGNSRTGFPFPASWIIYSSPAIGADGTIYFATTDGKVYAVNPEYPANPEKRWVTSLGETFVFSSPVLGDEDIYIGCNEGRLHALRMSDGVSQWTHQTDGAIMSTPAVDATGVIYVGSYDGKLHAVNPNGTARWSYTTGGPIYASPAIGPDGTVYVGSHDGFFYAIQGEGPLAGTAWPKFRKDAQHTGSIDPVKVVSSEPAHEATEVPRNTQFFTVTFNNPMQPSWDIGAVDGWVLSNETPASWSDDRRRFTIGRDNPGDLPANQTITFTLNGQPEQYFSDIYGNILPQTTIEFTTDE